MIQNKEELEKEFDLINGEVLLLDKPLTWSSFDVVKKIRYAAKIKKVGHAGTLDPLATGLLIVCIGKKTKKINDIQDAEKEYTGTIVVGKTTASFDLEHEVEDVADPNHLTEKDLKEAAESFLGWSDQIPPMYSAVRINGVRAYKHARKGEVVELKSRKVELTTFELTRVELPEVDFRIVCSKGTYIRSIARDFGEKLGVGGYLSKLRRERIGEYSVVGASDPATLADQIRAQVEKAQEEAKKESEDK
ncbi:tRNA pseudouridine(55) synthase TruB [Flammeovirgaceae bacterium SG7u.111]|nr:tRNA pseudouridine(55) synthase TruB [Flammeovirgaceae bacterium SG7u.132]WPO38781.1 tRNA pseudouridine(55) synthase TruB [Flammeovirgaceae bacterium SG7u.111]